MTHFMRGLSQQQQEGLARFLESGSAELPAVRLDPAARFEPFPLTDMQEAFWVGRNGGIELSNIPCQIYYELEAEELDLDLFAAAWNLLIARHDMLRAVI